MTISTSFYRDMYKTTAVFRRGTRRRHTASPSNTTPVVSVARERSSIRLYVSNPPVQVNGVMIVTTVIVSFHSIFITKVDRAYKLSCFYVEASKKVSQQLDVA